MKRPDHFYKFCTAEVGRIALSAATIRWSSPARFNDPFDCYFSLEPKFDREKVRERLKREYIDQLFAKTVPRLADTRFAEQFLMIRAAIAGKPRAVVTQVIEESFQGHMSDFDALTAQENSRWREEVKSYRILCVCEVINNLLVWSHYAKNHTGIAIQFECPEGSNSPLSRAERVRYRLDPPTMATADEWVGTALGRLSLPSGIEVWHRTVLTKMRAWKYEKEWRAVSSARPYDTQGFEDTPFNPAEVSNVFLGCRISNPDRAAVLGMIAGVFSHVRVFEARQHPTKFALEFCRIA